MRMRHDYRASRFASLRRELFFHRERRKMVETDPDLTPDEGLSNWSTMTDSSCGFLGQLIELEGH